jgi:hypothetical protein
MFAAVVSLLLAIAVGPGGSTGCLAKAAKRKRHRAKGWAG